MNCWTHHQQWTPGSLGVLAIATTHPLSRVAQVLGCVQHLELGDVLRLLGVCVCVSVVVGGRGKVSLLNICGSL